MKTFKKGDKVKVLSGVTYGNPTGEGVFDRAYTGYSSIRMNNGNIYNVGNGEFKLLNDEANQAFIARFLNTEGQQLFADGYLEVDMEPSEKMEAEMKIVAVETFLKEYKAKN